MEMSSYMYMPSLPVPVAVVTITAIMHVTLIQASIQPAWNKSCEKATITDKHCYQGEFMVPFLDSTGMPDFKCSPCAQDTYQPNTNLCETCRNLTICEAHEVDLKTNNGFKDTECGCKPWPIDREVCEEHNCTDLSCPSSCPVTIATTQVICPQCPDGTAGSGSQAEAGTTGSGSPAEAGTTGSGSPVTIATTQEICPQCPDGSLWGTAEVVLVVLVLVVVILQIAAIVIMKKKCSCSCMQKSDSLKLELSSHKPLINGVRSTI